jgi:transketolase
MIRKQKCLHLQKREMERIGFYTLMVDGTNVQAIDESLEEFKKIKKQAVCLILERTKFLIL